MQVLGLFLVFFCVVLRGTLSLEGVQDGEVAVSGSLAPWASRDMCMVVLYIAHVVVFCRTVPSRLVHLPALTWTVLKP